MIEVLNVNKSFARQQVLHDISCTFHPGACNLIIGQSGSGKTVLLKCLIGLLSPDGGSILYDGRDVLRMRPGELKMLRREIGVLFQGSALFDSMNVAQNVGFPLRMFAAMTAAERDERVRFCLERVGLRSQLGKYPSELSGGMQKRVAIARAIALNPRYLFCDEPNSGLDPQTSILIDQLLADITSEYGITTVINTHDMNSVLGIGDRVTFLSCGRVEWQGSKADILQTTSPALRDFLFASPILRKMKS